MYTFYIWMVPRIELTTLALQVPCSTNWAINDHFSLCYSKHMWWILMTTAYNSLVIHNTTHGKLLFCSHARSHMEWNIDMGSAAWDDASLDCWRQTFPLHPIHLLSICNVNDTSASQMEHYCLYSALLLPRAIVKTRAINKEKGSIWYTHTGCTV